MHLLNAISGTVENTEFQQVIQNQGINSNHCVGITANVINPNVKGRITIEIIFDFIPPGQSSQDMRVRIFFDPSNGSVEIHSIENPW